MESNQLIITSKNEYSNGESGYQIIEVNMADPAESLFSVVTPIKKQ